ncbi:MAG: FtsX-like permease family protein [Oligoflexia bacterium]|nr:FtsX-like permease family protein [Oligoflexia bacterium]
MLLRHAWKELEKKFSILFVLNLALGLSGLLAVETYRASLKSSLQENAQNILGADLAISARRPFTQNEIEIISEFQKNTLSNSEFIETYSMIQSNKESRLVLLKGIGANFPVRGFIELHKKGVIESGKASAILTDNKIWIESPLAEQLNLDIGSSLKIGDKVFIVDDFITSDPTQSFRSLTLSGRIFMSLENLYHTKLIRPESTVSFVKVYKIQNYLEAQPLADQWSQKFTDPSIRIRAASDAASDSGRMLSYLADFLGLSALVALFLSSLGAAYLFRTWLLKRTKVFAIHQVLGFSYKQAISIPIIQITLLSLLAVPLSYSLAFLEIRLINLLIQSINPMNINISIAPISILITLLISILGSTLLSVPFLFSLRTQNPKELLSNFISEPKWNIITLLLFIPALILFALLSLYEAQSYRIAGVFLASLLFSSAFFFGAGYAFLSLLKKVPTVKFAWPIRQAFLYLSRSGHRSLAAFSAIAIGVLLLNLLPQLRASLSAEIENPDQKNLPAFFLFDIQQDQIDEVIRLVKEKKSKLENISPMVRARLLSINDEEFERKKRAEGFQTREEENEARFRNRGFNLSYRNNLRSSESIHSGVEFNHSKEEIAQISLEQRFAKRLNINLGDILKFDIQGVELQGRVVNFRTVKWTSFQPNFFVLFQEGFLEDAPQIFLGSIMRSKEIEEIRFELSRLYPNISVIDLKSTIEKGLDLLSKMQWCLNLMSIIVLFTGFVVLLSIANQQSELRAWEVSLLQSLGAHKKQIFIQRSVEFSLLCFCAGLLGSGLSIFLSWIISWIFFEGTFVIAFTPLALSVALTLILGNLVLTLGSSDSWRKQPNEVLNNPS